MSIKTLSTRCAYTTDRLGVRSWQIFMDSGENWDKLTKTVLTLLTPKVTAALPTGWQSINTPANARNWIDGREREGSVFSIELLSSNEIIGLLFLYENPDEDEKSAELKIGYLFSEKYWGQGFGSEMIRGLVDRCRSDGGILKISGAVEKTNTASIRILQKNGFAISKQVYTPTNMIFLERVVDS